MSFKGMLAITGRIFDRWQSEVDFLKDILDVAEILQSRSGLQVRIDEQRIKIVHERWLNQASAWLQLLLPNGTNRLSHLKMSALLLEAICVLTPFEVAEKASRQVSISSIQDGGMGMDDVPNKLDEYDRRKLVDGASHFIGWQIAYQVCRHFESERTDRRDPFVERITEEFELDMVSCLLSGRVSAQGLHMTLKALFMRD